MYLESFFCITVLSGRAMLSAFAAERGAPLGQGIGVIPLPLQRCRRHFFKEKKGKVSGNYEVLRWRLCRYAGFWLRYFGGRWFIYWPATDCVGGQIGARCAPLAPAGECSWCL